MMIWALIAVMMGMLMPTRSPKCEQEEAALPNRTAPLGARAGDGYVKLGTRIIITTASHALTRACRRAAL